MADTEDLVPHMRRVQVTDREMRDLEMSWQMIEASAAISCPDDVQTILPTLQRTRERFEELKARLIEQLAEESRAALADDLTAQAQCAIDILVRNLFERTADVGFLATDDVLRAFCRASDDEQTTQRAAMQTRLAQYQAKYTVYDDIAVLAPDGRLLARLDTAADLQTSSDPIVANALKASAYVEQFAVSDLGAADRPSLLYAHRIDDGQGRDAGVLVLRFKFYDEMERIFASVVDERHQVALVLIDAHNRVVVTNDASHVPVGVRMHKIAERDIALTSFAGRDYLSVVCPTHGYQGYMGPGWRAQALVSLLSAFRKSAETASAGDDIALDNAELKSIQHDAEEINRNLRRVVWNGRLMAASKSADRARLKAVLTQVTAAGARTRTRLGHAVDDLHRTALGRTRRQAHELARLAADIMDRNLYERANDCRWWALSPVLQRVLATQASAQSSGENTAELNRVLDHINGLYTVYSRLVAFDAHGTIRGVSNDNAAQSLIGSTIDARWLQQVSALPDAQRYAVSAYAPTNLHEHGATYVYLAAVRDADARRVIGGVAIVFHAARELRAMLHDVLGKRGGIAAFIDHEGRVLASSDDEFAVGTQLPFLKNTAKETDIVPHGEYHYTCARVQAAGYREFKTSDGHNNHVSAVVALRLGSIERRRRALHEIELRGTVAGAGTQQKELIELGVFQVGPALYALPTAAVMEAQPLAGLVRTPASRGSALGLIEVTAGQRSRLVQVMCARALLGVEGRSRTGDGVILVIRSPHVADLPVLGLRVDEVLTVIDVTRAQVQTSPDSLQGHAPLIAGLIDLHIEDDRYRGRMIQLLDEVQLRSLLMSGQRAADTAAVAEIAANAV